MGATRFQAGARIQLRGKQYQVLRKLDERHWQLEAENKQILQLAEAQIHLFVADGSLTFPGVGRTEPSNHFHLQLSDQEHNMAKVRMAYVRATINHPNTASALKPVIQDVWGKLKEPPRCPSSTTVYNWKRRYKESHHDIRSLVDANASKGNRAPRYDKEVIDICQQSINDKYLRRERPTIQSTLEMAMMRVRERNAIMPASLALPMPTRRLMTRLILAIPVIDKHRARFGNEAARHLFRSVHGRVHTERPLQVAEMDHTLLDLFVLDESTGMAMGRPWVTACICVYSRNLLGIHIGFTPPSYSTVAKCLKHCFLPKVGLKEEYPEIKSDWTAFGVMEELVIDNGLEFHSSALEQACGSLGITIRYAPRKEPWFKGHIERFFGTFNRAVAHGHPGTTFSNIFDKADYDPAQQAVITLATLRTVVMKWVVDVYHQEHHRSLQTSPFNKWQSTVSLEDIRHPDETTQLDAVMARPYERVLTHKGIEYEGLLFNSPELDAMRRMEGPRLKVRIGVDEDDLGSIFVLTTHSGRPLVVPCIDQQYAAGTSLWAHRVCKRAQASLNISEDNVGALLEAKQHIQELIANDFKGASKVGKRVARFKQGSRSSRPSSLDVPSDRRPENAVKVSVDMLIEQEHFAGPPEPRSEAITTDGTRARRIEPIYRRRNQND